MAAFDIFCNPQAAGDDQCDLATGPCIQVPSGPSQGRDGWDRDVVTEDQRRRARAAAAAIKDDVVGARLKREVDIILNMVGRQFEADGDAAGALTDFIGNILEISRRDEVLERGG